MAATQAKPNILLITTDQQRFDGLGINAPHLPLRTPTLDALAASGMNFTRAYSTSPVCIPARRSLLSGLHPQTHGLRGYQDGLDWDAPISLPQILRDNGWQTQLIGKLHLHPQRKRYGFEHQIRVESSNDRWDVDTQAVNHWADWMREQGHQHPNDLGISGNGRVVRPWDKDESTHLTSWLANSAVDFFTKETDPSRPWFTHLSFVAPHPPLTPPQAYLDRYADKHGVQPSLGDWAPQGPVPAGIPDDSPTGPFALDDIQRAMSGYWGSINHIDDRIRFVLSRLFEYRTARAAEPIIIFATDHGEMLGDHHLFRKSLPYEGSAHIPFFITGKNIGLQRGSCDELVCLEDIVATVLDRCGLTMPQPLGDGLNGTSLMPLLQGKSQAPRQQLFGECSQVHYVIENHKKYIWFARTGEEQLFDLKTDPNELHDLSGQPGQAAQLQRFREHFAKHHAERQDINYDQRNWKPCCNQPPQALWGHMLQSA